MRIPLNSPQCSSFALSKLEYIRTYVEFPAGISRTGRLRSSIYICMYVRMYIIHVRAGLAVKVSTLEYISLAEPHPRARSARVWLQAYIKFCSAGM